jgi:hypothetical protein
MQADGAIIVKLVEQPAHEVTVGDVIIGSLGIAGLMTLSAIVLGLGVGWLLIRRSRNRGIEQEHPPSIQTQ